MNKHKRPKISTQNGLQLDEKPESLHLSDLENVLIARNFVFMKVFTLPKSRMSAAKDKIVNVPIPDTDVLNTLKSFPRLPKDSCLFPVHFKRKKEYKSGIIKSFINIDKLFDALTTLKELGNPFYQSILDSNEYKKLCQERDPENYKLLFEDPTDVENEKSDDYIYDNSIDLNISNIEDR